MMIRINNDILNYIKRQYFGDVKSSKLSIDAPDLDMPIEYNGMQSITNLMGKATELITLSKLLQEKLPSNIKIMVSDIFANNLTDVHLLPQGLERLLAGQKEVVSNLNQLADLIEASQKHLVNDHFQEFELLGLANIIDLYDEIKDGLNHFLRAVQQALKNGNDVELYLSDIRTLLQSFTKSNELGNINDNYLLQSGSSFRSLLLNVEKNLPKIFDHPLVREYIPELKNLYLTSKIGDILRFRECSDIKLQQACNLIRDIAKIISHNCGINKEGAQLLSGTSQAITLVTPIYFLDGLVLYPAIIDIYHERDRQKEKNEIDQSETWLRVSIATDNIGMVILVFRLQQEKLLSININVADKEGAAMLNKCLSNMGDRLEGFHLQNVNIN